MPRPTIPTQSKPCKTCGNFMTRKRFASGTLEDRRIFLKREYCSLSCANSRRFSESRKAYHKEARRLFLKAKCEKCGAIPTPKLLHVHHIDGDWTNNIESNCMTLCAKCHKTLHCAQSATRPREKCASCSSASVKAGFCGRCYQKARRARIKSIG